MFDEIFAISAYGQEIYVGEDGIREIHGQYYRPGEALMFLKDESDPVNTNQPDPYKQAYLQYFSEE